MSKLLKITGSDELKIRFHGHTYYDHTNPFDFTIPLEENAAKTYTIGQAQIMVGVDGDSVSIAVSVLSFPIFHQTFALSTYVNAVPFDAKAFGEEAKGTIELQDAV